MPTLESSPRILNRPTRTPNRTLMQSPSQFIVAPRAQVSRRGETQAPLSGKPPSFATVSVPGRLPRAPRTPIAGDGTKNRLSRSEQRTLQQTKNNYLTGKAPYGFESTSLQRGIRCEPGYSRPTFVTAACLRDLARRLALRGRRP